MKTNNMLTEERLTISLSPYTRNTEAGSETCECARCSIPVEQGSLVTIRLCIEDDNGNDQFHDHEYLLCSNCTQDYALYFRDLLTGMFTAEQLPELDDRQKRLILV
jgi:hypothetical protein